LFGEVGGGRDVGLGVPRVQGGAAVQVAGGRAGRESGHELGLRRRHAQAPGAAKGHLRMPTRLQMPWFRYT
jgi:hypothetical protein